MFKPAKKSNQIELFSQQEMGNRLALEQKNMATLSLMSVGLLAVTIILQFTL